MSLTFLVFGFADMAGRTLQAWHSLAARLKLTINLFRPVAGDQRRAAKSLALPRGNILTLHTKFPKCWVRRAGGGWPPTLGHHKWVATKGSPRMRRHTRRAALHFIYP